MYTTSVQYKDILEQDKVLFTKNLKANQEEINHYVETSELFISLFKNTIRTKLASDKRDYIQLVAVRIFQDSRSALDLALKGLYPQSAALTRGALESLYLIHDFRINPKHEEIWFDGSKNKRLKLFKLGKIRERLSESNKVSTEPMDGLYKLLSNYSIHINQESYLWYISIKGDMLYYHWAGQEDDKRSAVIIASACFTLSHSLMVLVEEGIYTFTNKDWLKKYAEWKGRELKMMKKIATLLSLDIGMMANINSFPLKSVNTSN